MAVSSVTRGNLAVLRSPALEIPKTSQARDFGRMLEATFADFFERLDDLDGPQAELIAARQSRIERLASSIVDAWYRGSEGDVDSALARAYDDFERERARRGSGGSIYSMDGRWLLTATSATMLRDEGHLAAVWERLDEKGALPLALSELPVRGDIDPVGLGGTLGRRWRKDHPDFWRRLSPLGVRQSDVSHDEGEIPPRPADPESDAFAVRLRRWREAQLEEARRDADAFSGAKPKRDLRSSPINGSMDDREDDVEEERWR